LTISTLNLVSTYLTNMTMVISCTRSYSKRNLSIKAIISVFVGIGICCALVAIRSCRWFVFLKNETNENRLIEEWGFFPEIMNSTTSIGLFRHETNNNISYEVLYDDTTDTFNNNVRCEPYPKFWVGVDYRWKFTAQLFVMLGPIIAFQSLCLAIIGANRFWICTFLLLAMGLQTATVITSVSWCDRYWDCPWLLGAKVNLIAACSFLLGWLFAMLGLVDNNDNNNNNEQNSRAKKNNSDEGIVEAYDSDDNESISVNITNVHDEEEYASTSGEMTQVDLEDGSNDVIIYNPWVQDEVDGSINDDNRKNKDDDDDDDGDDDDEEEDNEEKKYTKKRVSQSNQIFLDLAPKLEQRRHRMMEAQ
jgi:hypothetical protein